MGLQDPDGYLRFRYSQNRIHWLGLTIVPLHSLCERVELSTGSFQIVPRHYRTDLIFALWKSRQSPQKMTQRCLKNTPTANRFPSPERARNQLCQLIGLDPFLVSEAEIMELRDLLYSRLRDKAAAAIQAVTRDCFGGVKPELEVAVYALGESLLARPALLQAGFEAGQLRGLALKRETGLWSASSVFAMALLALEKLTGQRFELEGTAL